MKAKNNSETNSPLRDLSVSEREIYSFNAANGQIEVQPEDENVISVDFPGLEVFNRSVTTKLVLEVANQKEEGIAIHIIQFKKRYL